MCSYITNELLAVLREHFPSLDLDHMGITGASPTLTYTPLITPSSFECLHTFMHIRSADNLVFTPSDTPPL